MKYRQSKWLNAFVYSLRASLLITVVFSFGFSFEVFFNSYENLYQYMYEYIIMIFMFILGIGFFALIITFISCLIIGLPTVLILKRLKFERPIFAAITGGLSVMFALEEPFKNFDWYYVILILYGFISGYAFMYGYKTRAIK